MKLHTIPDPSTAAACRSQSLTLGFSLAIIGTFNR
jgi:hypothetical protein